MAKSSPIDLTIVDGASLYDAAAFITESAARTKVTIDYSKLRERLNSLRREHGWRESTLNTIMLSIDPNSEGQQRFQSMLVHAEFEVDAIPFRDTFVSVPPGRSHTEVNGTGKPVVSLAPRIAYIAGLMSKQSEKQPPEKQLQILVVSHAFELYGPLVDVKQRLHAGGRVGIAYFGRLLDYRWKVSGLLDHQLGIEFFDLDAYGDELLGIELTGRARSSLEVTNGLSRF
jgi:hypothetical protein